MRARWHPPPPLQTVILDAVTRLALLESSPGSPALSSIRAGPGRVTEIQGSGPPAGAPYPTTFLARPSLSIR
jgi:hypothetical protein